MSPSAAAFAQELLQRLSRAGTRTQGKPDALDGHRVKAQFFFGNEEETKPAKRL
jgi:hypothetical protein